MPHYPSNFKNAASGSLPKRADSLNATQQKSSSHAIFSIIEEELHDARRVHSHGQEEDLRLALNMVISRVNELSTLLSEAYKTQAELEVQLNVAKSNLQLVISNNEMLEEALKRDSSGSHRDVGWRRSGARESEQRDRRTSDERPGDQTPNGEVGSNSPPPTGQEGRFFKFRFTAGSSQNPGTRPGTPQDTRSPTVNGGLHLSSPSLPTLLSHAGNNNKEVEDLTAELQKERTARKAAMEQKTALEAELESLSQALFEEANKMVATERIKRAETEDELKEALSEREALRSALRLLEGENKDLRTRSEQTSPVVPSVKPRTRSSSEIALKSAPTSPYHSRPPTPPTATVLHHETATLEDVVEVPSSGEGEGPQVSSTRRSRPASLQLTDVEPSPWADVPSQSPLVSLTSSVSSAVAQ